MRKVIYIFIALASAWGLGSAETRLIGSDPYSATIEYTMGSPEFKANRDGQRSVFLPDCQNSGQPGAPAIPELSLSIGVPSGARAKVQIISVESEDLADFDLIPAPRLVSSGQPGLGTYEYSKDLYYYNRASFYPANIAELVSMERLRQYNIARVKLAPAQYDPLGGILKLNKRIIVKVSWDIAGRAVVAPSDQAFEAVFSRLLVNYQQCRDWKAEDASVKSKAADPFEGYPVWYRISVLQEGIYRLDYDYFLRNGIDPAIIDPRTVKLFSGGSKALPKDRNAAVPDTMKQVALWVKGQEDGRFDPEDYIVFYGQDLSGWNKNSRLTTPQFFNPYTDTNRYWLTWGGEAGSRMQVRDCEPGSGEISALPSFTDTLHFEREIFNPFNSGEFYYWANLRRTISENSRTYSFDMTTPGVQKTNGKMRISYRAGIYSKHRLAWGLNGSTAKDLSWVGSPGPTSDGGYEPIITRELNDSADIGNLQDAANTLTITLLKEGADTTDVIYLNWAELIYSRKYQAYKGGLKFRADSAGQAISRFYLTGFNSDSCLLLDISDPENPDLIGTSKIFSAYIQFDDAWSPGNRYYAAAPAAWLVPSRIEEYVPNHLRQAYADVKYLIIAADQLWPQAQALLTYHGNKPEHLPAKAVKLSWIYNEFGMGLNDPSAIRNFLKFIYVNSGGTSPSWCVLFGNGNYDYRHVDRSIANSNLIPTHQEDILNYVLEEYQLHSYDDWYANPTTDQYPQFAVGRLPAASSEEAWAMVNKIPAYESPKTMGSWRTGSILVADDLTPDGAAHMNAAENLYHKTPGIYTVQKVYGVQYDLDRNDHKPEARADLVRYWNEGSGIVNFVGHGAWWTWGHEWYFRDTDVPYLSNAGRLPLVITASCGVSRFDNPYYKCINSLAVIKTSGGAIASFGSTREGYGSANNNLNYNLYSSLFDSLLDLGLAVTVAKVASHNPDNNQCYTLLGDPGLKFSLPANSIDLSVDSDTLYGQGRYHISGKVNAQGNFSGRVAVELRDIPRVNPDYNYQLPGNVIYKGEFTVVNDSFSTTVNIPDQLHITPESGAKIRAYAWNSSIDAAGVNLDTLWIGGVDPNPDTSYQDTAAPKIEVYAGEVEVKAGDYLPSRSKFRVQLSDRSGLNIAPNVSKYGEIKFMVIKGGKQLSSSDIAGGFVYSISSDSMTAGSAPCEFVFDSSGQYTIRVEAYDTKMNKGSWEALINVDTEMNIYSIYNYPNPIRTDTYFTFMLSQPGDVDIKIFTVSGDLIKDISLYGRPSGYNQVYWNGRDDRGDIPANGVYLYRISAKGDSGDNSEYGKLVIMR